MFSIELISDKLVGSHRFSISRLKITSFIPLFLHSINYFPTLLPMLTEYVGCAACARNEELEIKKEIFHPQNFQSRRKRKM